MGNITIHLQNSHHLKKLKLCPHQTLTSYSCLPQPRAPTSYLYVLKGTHISGLIYDLYFS